MQLDEQTVAVVTGAGNGLGQAIACQLAERGCRLVLVDIDHEGLGRTKELLNHCTASLHALDVAERRAMESLAAEIADECGRVHLLVNNAGVSLAGPLENFDIADFQWLMGVNFWGVVYACKCFLPLLRKAKEARICNILSGFALIGFPTKSAYAASKFAVRGFSESLQMELHAANVGMTCIYLGPVGTGLVRNERAWDSAKQQAEAEFLVHNGMQPAAAARRICRAIMADRRRVRVGWSSFVFDVLARLFPASISRIVGIIKSKIPFV